MNTQLESAQRTIDSLLNEYRQKVEAIDDNIAALQQAEQAAAASFTIAGVYVATLVTSSYVPRHTVERNLKIGMWRAVWDRLGMDRLATAKDRQLFEQTVAKAPEPTEEAIRATFGPYMQDPRTHILRGLAEVFINLDDAYKSHSKVKIGVEGLPKRIIMPLYDAYGGYRDQFYDMVDALAAYQGRPLFDRTEWTAMWDTFKTSNEHEIEGRGIRVKLYKNGNAHVFFDKETLLDINRALAEFYGDVLPDAEPEVRVKNASTEVSKDLAYYPTPVEVIERMLYNAYIPEGSKVLEPSCGDGRILDWIRANYACERLGVEVDRTRASQAIAKGHNVLCKNFLECVPTGDIDVVAMNPPFSGKHYQKHVRHALKFLNENGRLYAVLPATAKYDHGFLDELHKEGWRAQWCDLPVASFAESGTRVPTGYIDVRWDRLRR